VARTSAWAMCALLSCTVSGAARTESPSQRLIGLSDLIVNPSYLSRSLSLPPDGHRLAIENATNLQVLNTPEGTALKDLGEGLQPEWSPDGRQLAFYSSRSGSLQIWIWDAVTDHLEELTTLSSGVDPDPTTRIEGETSDALQLAWSPDGRQIAFASRAASVDTGPAGPLVLNNSTPPKWTLAKVFANPGHDTGVPQLTGGRDWGYRFLRPGESLASQIYSVDVRTKNLRTLTHGNDTFFHPAWSPDSRSIVAAAVSSSSPIEDLDTAVTQTANSWRSKIVTINVDTGAEVTVVSGEGDLRYYPQWSPDGSKIAFWWGAGIYATPRLYVTGLNGGGILSAGPELKVPNFSWTNRKNTLLVSYGLPERRLALVTIGSPRISPLVLTSKTGAKSVGAPYRWSQIANGTLAWLHGSELWYLPAEKKVAILMRDFDSQSHSLQMGHIEVVKWRNREGEEREGGLLYPAEYRPGAKYPLIVDAYPFPANGTSSDSRSWQLPREGNRAWASMGYLVFKPGPRAPFYVNFTCPTTPEDCRGPHGWELGVDDLMSGVDYLVQHGVADPARMCLYGHSNGGGFASYLVAQTHAFKCAVILAPVMADLIRPTLLNTDGGSIAAYVDGLTMDNNIDDYVSMSSVLHLQKVTTPLLIAVGDQDGEMLLNAIELYNGVRRSGTEVTLVRYPNQGHLIQGDALVDLWGRETAFFGRFLQPQISQQTVAP
jgi:dipeptidyl aminopeptidase/acylaminoacyl peptidase